MATSSAFAYFTRVLPALSVVGVITILIFAFGIVPHTNSQKGNQHAAATSSQLLLSVYTLFLHVLSIMFPARLCWAVGDVVKRMTEETATEDNVKPKKRKTVAVKTDQGTTTFPVPLFAIIVPAYKEEVETMEETLRVLASHSQARQCYDIYLAMEQKEAKVEAKAESLIKTFQKSFRRITYTIHPAGIPGEAQGKSSNESWAARQAFKDYPEEVKKNVIITTMDADTHLSSRYFSRIARYHIESPETNEMTVYVSPLVFDRNLHNVPLSVRVADLVWAGAGLSSLYSGSRICIPTSVYSLPMTLVEHVGGWDTGPGAIGEDLHMYLKCFFALSGNFKVQIVYAAASVCNVSSDLKGVEGYIDGLKARYRQALRHMWGSLDTGYAVRQTVEMISRHRAQNADSAKQLNKRADTPIEMDKPLVRESGSRQLTSPRSIDKENVLIIFHRLFEAHFLPVHLATILAVSFVYENVLRGPMPNELRWALQLSGLCRGIGWSLMALFFYRYEKYHRLCVALRQKEMLKAGMLEDITEHDGFSPKVSNTHGLLEAAVFPIGGFIFGAIPHCQAIMSHLFTDKLIYHVSLKPQFALQRWRASTSSSTTQPSRSKTSHTRCPSDSWRKQAASLSMSFQWNRPVKRKD